MSSASVKPAPAQVAQQRVPALRREPDAEVLGGRAVEPALGEERRARRRPPGVTQLLAVELLGDPVRLEQPRRLPGSSPGRGAPPSSYRSCTPDPAGEVLDGLGEAAARRPSARTTMTSPPSPQPKQWYRPTCGRTWKDGDRSSWNGHRPFIEPTPADFSVTCSPTISSMWARSRTASTSSRRIRPATRASLGVGAPTRTAFTPAPRRRRAAAGGPAGRAARPRETSVSEATWSITTRSRAASSAASAQSAANGGSRAIGAAVGRAPAPGPRAPRAGGGRAARARAAP